MVILLPEQRAVFLHARKTGGSTITALLKDYAQINPDHDERPVGDHGWQFRYHAIGKMHHGWFKHVDELAELHDRGWTFWAVLRNPWHRVASHARFAKAPRTLQEPCTYIGGPHADYLRFEGFEPEVRRMLDTLGIPQPDAIPHVNEYAQEKNTHFDHLTRKMILDVYRKDIEMGGYTGC